MWNKIIAVKFNKGRVLLLQQVVVEAVLQEVVLRLGVLDLQLGELNEALLESGHPALAERHQFLLSACRHRFELLAGL